MQINVEHFTLGRLETNSRFAEISGGIETDLPKATMRGIRGGVEFRGEHCQSAFLSRTANK